MAEQLAQLKKKGGAGSFTETVLWTNSNPSATFAAQDVNLSSAYTNFDYIKVYYNESTSSLNECNMMFDPSVVTASVFPLIGAYSSGTYARTMDFASVTKLHFAGANRTGASGSNNNLAIPTKVCGLK